MMQFQRSPLGTSDIQHSLQYVTVSICRDSEL